MKITVITATWNSGKTIGETLASFNGQDYSNTEYIIVDGGSIDNTINIIEANGRRVDKLVSEKDKGIYDALNKGVDLATGDAIGFLHSDDVFSHSSVLSNIAKAFGLNDVDAVYGDLDYVAKADMGKIIRRWKSGVYSRNKFKNGWMPPHPTFYMKRNCYERYGAFNLDYKIAADYDSLLRYMWSNNISVTYLPEVLIKMRVGGESNKSIMNIFNKSREDIQAMQSNNIPVARALLLKNLSKVPQFFKR